MHGIAAIEARLKDVEAQYAAEVVPGVSDDSVLEAERDTLEWCLAELRTAESVEQVQARLDLVEAIRRLQNIRTEAVESYGVDLDDPDWGVDNEEAWGVIKTLDQVLDVLHLLALGQTPAQGE